MSVRLICAPEKTWATRFMRRHFMEYQRKTAGVIEHSHYEFREDIKRIDGPDQILALVRKQPKCIGFVEYQPGLDFSGIDVLAVRDSWKDDLIKPKLTEVVQENYSLCHPGGRTLVGGFIRTRCL